MTEKITIWVLRVLVVISGVFLFWSFSSGGFSPTENRVLIFLIGAVHPLFFIFSPYIPIFIYGIIALLAFWLSKKIGVRSRASMIVFRVIADICVFLVVLALACTVWRLFNWNTDFTM